MVERALLVVLIVLVAIGFLFLIESRLGDDISNPQPPILPPVPTASSLPTKP